jgi:hypothetical protein
MVGAIVVFAVIAPEGKIDLDPTPLTIQTMRRPKTGKYVLTPYF